jgi:hypothetical protein
VAAGRPLVVAQLMASSANALIENVCGLTPWDLAVKHQRAECLRQLEHAALFRGG